MSKNEEGSFLVEVLVASVVLLLIAAGAVSQLTSLTNIKVQTETRDRGLVLANSLHENMQAAGCGFDVSSVKDPDASIDQKPWARVGSCAFKSIEKSRLGDEEGNVYFGSVDAAKSFCTDSSINSDALCEMGDQDFDREIYVNGGSTKVKFHVTVNYWFEKTGETNSTTSCDSGLPAINTVNQPDVIVRKVNVSWPNVSKANDKEDITVIKRQNIPADTVEFSSSSRVGLYSSSANTVVLLPKIDTDQFTKVSRIKRSSANGGANCVWFPYIDKENRPSFLVDGMARTSSSYLDNLENGPI